MSNMEEKIVDSFIIKQHNEIAELKHKIELLTNRWEKLKSFIFNRPYCSRIELEVNELRLLNSILEKMEELEDGKDINVATIEEMSPPPREEKGE